jgi:hypothetical protein
VNALAIITRLEELLQEERAAIARLQGPRVEALAEEKKRLAAALEATPREERQLHADRLRKLVADLRVNGVLIAQARSILREFIFGPADRQPVAGWGWGRGRRDVAQPPRRLSVRG